MQRRPEPDDHDEHKHGQHDQGHGHGQGHEHSGEMSELSDAEARVRALESILTEKSYIAPGVLDRIVQEYETRIGPHIGARVIAKAWLDPAFKQDLLFDASAAIASLGIVARIGDDLIAVENSSQRHNLVVCTLCSCYPYEVLGLPPVWYKSAPYRARAVREPRSVLREFGVDLPEECEVRVWDSTAETRYIVLPMRPEGTEGWTEEQLAALVTRDAMIGTGIPASKS
jgi:nitrile hydratase